VFDLENVKSIRELTRLLAVGEGRAVQPDLKSRERARARPKPKAKSRKLRSKSSVKVKPKSTPTVLTQRSHATRRKR